MTKDSKPKIIMHTSIGREFDLSDREDPAKAILDLYAKIEKYMLIEEKQSLKFGLH